MAWGTATKSRVDPIGLLDDLADAVDAYILDRTHENFDRLTAVRLQIKKARTTAAAVIERERCTDTTVDL